jgi:hypothetical protein
MARQKSELPKMLMYRILMVNKSGTSYVYQANNS